MFKVDLHIHTDLDPKDGMATRKIVQHSVDELFFEAKKQGFDALALTHHLKLIDTPQIRASAERHGILYIPGVEVQIHGMDVLLLNPPHDEVYTFEGLRELREKHPEMLVIAPHPFYPGKICLGKELERNIGLFDGIEYSHYYLSWYNRFNEKALEVADKHNLPILGNSDVHYMPFFGTTYSLIDSEELTMESLFEAIRQGKTTHISDPLTFKQLLGALVPFARRLPHMLLGENFNE